MNSPADIFPSMDPFLKQQLLMRRSAIPSHPLTRPVRRLVADLEADDEKL